MTSEAIILVLVLSPKFPELGRRRRAGLMSTRWLFRL
jgi:hypothetical protein